MKHFLLSLSLLSISQIHTMNDIIETEPKMGKLFCINMAALEAAAMMDETPTNACKAFCIANTAINLADCLTRECLCLPIDVHNQVKDNCSDPINHSLLAGIIYLEKLWKKPTPNKMKKD